MEKKLQKLCLKDYNYFAALGFGYFFINSCWYVSKEIHEIKYTNCIKCCLEYAHFKDGLIEIKCLCCNKSYQKVW